MLLSSVNLVGSPWKGLNSALALKAAKLTTFDEEEREDSPVITGLVKFAEIELEADRLEVA